MNQQNVEIELALQVMEAIWNLNTALGPHMKIVLLMKIILS